MNVLIGVCGSIAAYKAFDLVRGLAKSGLHVRVILTQGALEFVRPQVFKHLGAEAVYFAQDDHNGDKSLFDGLESKQVLHIALARWAHKFIAAPVTANTFNKLGSGLADDLLTCAFLALKPEIPKLLFPAMNPAMWENIIVKKNYDVLASLPNTFVHDTSSGEMVCGEYGDGKLASVDEMLQLAETWDKPSNSKELLITTGATIAPLDPVRFLTNSSTGETGFILSLVALKLGYRVHLVAGKNSTKKLELLSSHPRFHLTRINTTEEMKQVVLNKFPTCSAYISSAAIGDFHFDSSNTKIKKDKLSQSLPIKPSPDILKEVLSLRQSHQTIIGFAAETDLSLNVLEKKWQSKPVDLLVGTKVDFNQGFGEVEASYLLYRGAGAIQFQGTLSKYELALKIMEAVSNDQAHSLHV